MTGRYEARPDDPARPATAELQRRLERMERLAADLARKSHLSAKHVATFGNCTHNDCVAFYGRVEAFRGNH